jgi:IS1 family transposase
MTGVAKNTVVKLLLDLAEACAAYHNRYVRNLKVRRLQCDEIWNFVGAKAKNATPERKAEGWGDTWTWTALDADTKLCISHLVGGRDLGWAKEFMEDCASRISNRVQVTTDGHKAYLEAVENAFGADIDYAQLQKIYGAPLANEARYSPARCIGCDMKVVSGNPDPKHVSTSFVELHENEHSPFYSAHERILQESRKPRGSRCPLVHVLQLLPCPSDVARYASNGGRISRPRLGNRRASATSCTAPI